MWFTEHHLFSLTFTIFRVILPTIYVLFILTDKAWVIFILAQQLHHLLSVSWYNLYLWIIQILLHWLIWHFFPEMFNTVHPIITRFRNIQTSDLLQCLLKTKRVLLYSCFPYNSLQIKAFFSHSFYIQSEHSLSMAYLWPYSPCGRIFPIKTKWKMHFSNNANSTAKSCVPPGSLLLKYSYTVG